MTRRRCVDVGRARKEREPAELGRRPAGREAPALGDDAPDPEARRLGHHRRAHDQQQGPQHHGEVGCQLDQHRRLAEQQQAAQVFVGPKRGADRGEHGLWHTMVERLRRADGPERPHQFLSLIQIPEPPSPY